MAWIEEKGSRELSLAPNRFSTTAAATVAGETTAGEATALDSNIDEHCQQLILPMGLSSSSLDGECEGSFDEAVVCRRRVLQPRMRHRFAPDTELVIEDHANLTVTVLPVKINRRYHPVYRLSLVLSDKLCHDNTDSRSDGGGGSGDMSPKIETMPTHHV
eukprot:UC4_evm1s535